VNRRMRNRTSGGVGGRGPQDPLLPDQAVEFNSTTGGAFSGLPLFKHEKHGKQDQGESYQVIPFQAFFEIKN
jgi:hypothetical protein